MAFTSFALMMIVAAFECRSETGTVFTLSTFDSKQMNWAALGEFVLAVLTTQMDALRGFLGTTDLSMKEFRWALIPAVLLLGLWELGKFVVRRQSGVVPPAVTPSSMST
jgi:Ca2+-transporting ATPase